MDLQNTDVLIQLKETALSALSSCPSVLELCVFGSLAKDSYDAVSDIDLFVKCSNTENSTWIAASTLMLTLPVLYVRPFSSSDPPSSRYWFRNYPPFNKLDISFHLAEEYDHILRHGVPGYIEEPYLRIQSSENKNRSQHANSKTNMLSSPHSKTEAEMGKKLLRFLDCLKTLMRNKESSQDLNEIAKSLQSSLSTVEDLKFSGGDLIGLAESALIHYKQMSTPPNPSQKRKT